MMMSLRPDILVLDEPVDGLDPVMRRQIWSIVMSDVAENGTSVLISSHNLRELEDVCDHVGIMNRGKIMIERTLSDLQEGIGAINVHGSLLPKYRGAAPCPTDLTFCTLHRPADCKHLSCTAHRQSLKRGLLSTILCLWILFR